MIHRDLKPDNIMVGEFGEVLVMDWGLADLHAKDITTFEAAKAAISRITVSPNGLWAATGSAEGDVRIWPLPMSKPAK